MEKCFFLIHFFIVSLATKNVISTFLPSLGNSYTTTATKVSLNNVLSHEVMSLTSCILQAERKATYALYKPLDGLNEVDCYQLSSNEGLSPIHAIESITLTKVVRKQYSKDLLRYVLLRLLSQGKDSSQSSTWTDGGKYIWSKSSTAFDGVFNQDFLTGGCTHTKLVNDGLPWLQVDLGAAYLIINVKIYNRKDCCSERLKNSVIFVSMTNSTFGEICQKFDKIRDSSQIELFWCNTPTRGRFVRLTTEAEQFSVCEFQVFGL